MKIIFNLLLISSLSFLVAGCSPQTDTKQSKANAVPLSKELGAIYQRSCKNCHEVAATGAPLTGDIERWNEILEKGMANVLDRALSGYQGMPAFGQCFECSPEQIEALITYMSNPVK